MDCSESCPSERKTAQSLFMSRILQEIVDSGNVNQRDSFTYTPLHKVCLHSLGSSESVSFMLNNGANVHAISESGDTPLHMACCRSAIDLGMISVLLAAGAAINSVNSDGDTPLIKLSNAPAKGRNEAMLMLLEAGANVNAVGKRGSALHVSCKCLELTRSTIELLLRQGASVHLRDIRGRTPLYVCCSRHPECTDVIAILQKAGSDCCESECGSSCLHAAAACPLVCVRTLDLLAQEGADINIMTAPYGRLPLHGAASNGNAVAVQWLMQRHRLDGTVDAAVNSRDSEGQTPFECACARPFENEEKRRVLAVFAMFGACEEDCAAPALAHLTRDMLSFVLEENSKAQRAKLLQFLFGYALLDADSDL